MTKFIFGLVIGLSLAVSASAHTLDEYLQATVFSVSAEQVHGSMRLVPGTAVFQEIWRTIDANSDGLVTDEEKQNYARQVLADLVLRIDGQTVQPRLESFEFSSMGMLKDGMGAIEVEWNAPVAMGSSTINLAFENRHLARISAYLVNALVPDDRSLQILSQARNPNQSSYELEYRRLGVQPGSAHSDEAQGFNILARLSKFTGMFRLGIHHIAEGTDHLLFLLTLLLPAPLLVARGRWAGASDAGTTLFQILKVVTAFTVGHSLSLAAAGFGFVRVPEAPIEVLIAASILVSAVHAVRPLFPRREAVVAAFFGLIHGLAFASALDRLGLGLWERIGNLLSFNLGIETMQLLVVVVTLPSLLLLSRSRVYPALCAGAAGFAAFAAAGWMVERTFGMESRVDVLVDAVAGQSVWIAVGLLLLSFICLFWPAHEAEARHGHART